MADYQDLFAPRAADPYMGPTYVAPVATTLPTTTPLPVAAKPIAGGPVGPVNNPLNPLLTPRYSAGATIAPAGTPGTYTYTQIGGRGPPRETGAVPMGVSPQRNAGTLLGVTPKPAVPLRTISTGGGRR